MLAREGFVVLELCYNMPKYGQESLHTRQTPIDISYIELAIKKVLAHYKSYGDRICLMGHSKGCDLVLGAASLLPDLVELVISNSCNVTNPMGHSIKYKDVHFESAMYGNTDDFIANGGKLSHQSDGIYTFDGFFEMCHFRNTPLFYRNVVLNIHGPGCGTINMLLFPYALIVVFNTY